MVEKYLQKLGLGKNEIIIFTFLNDYGPNNIASISVGTKLPRTTVDENLERLKEKGLAYLTVDEKIKKFASDDPKKIKILLENRVIANEKQKDQLEVINRNISDIIQSFASSKFKDLPSLDIRYYKGVDQVNKVYDKVLTHNEVRTYANLEEITSTFSCNIEKFLVAMEKGVKIWDLVVKNDKALEMEHIFNRSKNYKIKCFPDGFKFKPMDYLITDSGITIVSGGKTVEAIEINNKVLAENAAATYDLLWGFL